MFSTAQQRLTAQAPAQDVGRLSNGRFAPGHSGNPRGHKLLLEKQAEQQRKEAELFEAICKDVGTELNAVHLEFARQAARQLARAARTDDAALSVRLTNGAAKCIERIRSDLARRPQPVISAFDKYVQEKAAQR